SEETINARARLSMAHDKLGAVEGTRTISTPGAAATGCVVCGAAVDLGRCDHCGAAVLPGGWKILRQIAKGPHSRVFLAEKNGERAALKELLFALVPEAAQLDGFEREA